MMHALMLSNRNSNLQCRDCECWQAIWRDSSENRSSGENITTIKWYQASYHIRTPSVISAVNYLKKEEEKEKEKVIKIFLKPQHCTLVCSYLTSTVIYFRKCENTGGKQKRSH